MNIGDEERRVIILHRLAHRVEDIEAAANEYRWIVGGTSEHQRARERLSLQLAEIADGLGKACD